VELCLNAFIQGSLSGTWWSVSLRAGFSELFRFFSVKSHSTSAPPYQLVSEVDIGRIKGLIVPQVLVLYPDGNKKAL
jgi:hypothetical protein